MGYGYLDVLDENGNKTSEIGEFVEVHKKGQWHATAHVWIFNFSGEVLLQQRSFNNITFPGLLDISAAGHLDPGEGPEDAALRELFEETGIKAKKNDLEKIKVQIQIMDAKDYKNREFVHIFILRFEGHISDLKIDQTETAGFRFISLDQFEKEISDPELKKKYVPHGGYYNFIIKKVREELAF